jgi:RimJ/RimL family protein N-acetyltransferase
MGHPLWPLYDLRLRTPSLELRLPDEDELIALCRVAKAGVHDPDFMPFTVAWTDQPSPEFERGFIQFHWRTRAEWTPQKWRLELAVFHDGEPIGTQGIGADDFAVLREPGTGSWLGQRFQGRGFGKQMRAAVLQLAFAELGAVAARSGAYRDNAASLAVSRALGYEENGIARAIRRGQPADQILLRISRERWQAHRYCEVEVDGLDSCRDLFGV